MIICDTNVLAYLFLNGTYSEQAKTLLQADPVWAAPPLWRSEFRNILATYMRQGHLASQDALLIMHEAESFMEGNEMSVNSEEVIALTSSSKCSAYDCEFVALAKKYDLRLYTSDKQILTEFPDYSLDLKTFKAK